ncbi:MAG: FliA/WhiG family RNA polymerase sigma factor [Desulfobacteraceae bacterium]|nr:MAG: FliA/WhiG family RNA polymerase sigma factor [Desulfobacteraceae bacterium]
MGLAQRQIGKLETGENISRDQLIADYLPHVKRIVQRIAVHVPAYVEVDDLINAGIIGLIQAAERYDPTRDNKFITYAAFRIKGAVLSELRSRDFLSKSNRRKAREIENTYLHLEKKFGRKVKDEEVAEELGLSLNEFYRIKKISSISFISFEEIGYTSKEDRKRLMSYLINEDTEDALTLTRLNELEKSVAQAIGELTEKERIVISLYYWDEFTMKEIGRVLDITESRVSQIHSQAIGRLRRKLNRTNLIEDLP